MASILINEKRSQKLWSDKMYETQPIKIQQ